MVLSYKDYEEIENAILESEEYKNGTYMQRKAAEGLLRAKCPSIAPKLQQMILEGDWHVCLTP